MENMNYFMTRNALLNSYSCLPGDKSCKIIRVKNAMNEMLGSPMLVLVLTFNAV